MSAKQTKGESLYPIRNGQPQLMQSLVCFVDILGFSQQTIEAFENGAAADFLSRIRKALSSAFKGLRRDDELLQLFPSSTLYEVKVFTDNVVLGYPISGVNFGEPELVDILQIFSEYQLCLAAEGFLVRGGIAFGDLYMDDDIVFGEALIEAVKLDRGGGSPRICLAPSALDLAKEHLKEWPEIKSTPYYSELLLDADGEVFLNYLGHSLFAFPDAFFPDLIENHRETVIKGLESYCDIPSVKTKYEWAARYHNFFCTETVERYPIPSHPDADPEYGAACAEIQELASQVIKLEEYASQPSRLK